MALTKDDVAGMWDDVDNEAVSTVKDTLKDLLRPVKDIADRESLPADVRQEAIAQIVYYANSVRGVLYSSDGVSRFLRKERVALGGSDGTSEDVKPQLDAIANMFGGNLENGLNTLIRLVGAAQGASPRELGLRLSQATRVMSGDLPVDATDPAAPRLQVETKLVNAEADDPVWQETIDKLKAVRDANLIEKIKRALPKMTARRPEIELDDSGAVVSAKSARETALEEVVENLKNPDVWRVEKVGSDFVIKRGKLTRETKDELGWV